MNKQSGSPSVGWYWAGLSLVILLVIGVRIRLLNMPLERDEGEFAYIGQLMLEGVAPYKLAYAVKLPGTAAVYALCMAVFGQTAASIHLGLLLANVAGIVMVFLLAKRWFGAGVGFIAGSTYALMSLSWGAVGSAAHATQFIVPVALGGILLLLRALESGGLAALFGSGLLFGFAFLLKQPGILFGAFGGLLLLDNELKTRPVYWMPCFKKAAIFCLGIILPFAVLCLFLWHAGVFEKFWFWSFRVAGGGWISLRQGWDAFIWYIGWLQKSRQLILWILAGLTLPFVYWMPAARAVRMPFLVLCAISIFAGCLSFTFNPHYFVLALPAAGMVIGLGVVEASRLLKSSKSFAFASFLPVALFCAVCGDALMAEHYYYFDGTLDQITTRIYGSNPFREAVQVADYIKKNSAPDSRIAVFGSEPEIYFLAHRRSATGHVSTYILMENRPYSHDMQEEMIQEIKAANPEYVVFVQNIFSSFPAPRRINTLLNVMVPYIKDRYERVGVVITDQVPKYYWDAATESLPDNLPSPYIFVFKLAKPAAVTPSAK
jgi:hypothetical protein